MSLNEAVRTTMVANAPLVALVADRMRPIILAPGEARPALTFRIMNVLKEMTQDGPVEAGSATLQVASWSDDLDERDIVVEAVITALHCFDEVVTVGERRYELTLFQQDDSDSTDPPDLGEEFPLYASLTVFKVQFQLFP